MPLAGRGDGSGKLSFCVEDVSNWRWTRTGLFVPVSVATRALRPAVTGLQQRLCDCAASIPRIPAVLRFVFVAKPGSGRTEVQASAADAFDALAVCVGHFAVVYPPLEFNGDVLDCAAGPQRCTSSPASFVAPFQVDLNRGT